MFGIKWSELRLPPPPGLFLWHWFAKHFPTTLSKKFGFKWWVSQRELQSSGELKGFIRGEQGFFESLVPLFLAAGCLLDNKQVIGVENAKKFASLTKNGAKGTILADHKGFADTFLIQVGLAVKCGLWEQATRLLLPVIGLMYASRYPFESLLMRAGNFVVAVPPTMAVPKTSQEEARKIWEALKTQYPAGLSAGYIGLIFAEGTRSRSGAMIQTPSGIAEILKHPGSIYLPTAIEGTEKILPPADARGIPLPILTEGTKIIFGEILTFEYVEERARQLQKDFRVNHRQAFIDVIYREIALLHEKHGSRSYMGHYGRPLEDIYPKRAARSV